MEFELYTGSRLFPYVHLLKQNILKQFWSLFFSQERMKFVGMAIQVKIYRMTLSFFYQRYRTRVSTDRFSRVPLFRLFYPKINWNVHFDSVFSNTGWFIGETINAVRFSIIKIRTSINFMHLRLKLTLELCQKAGSVDGKTKQNHLKAPTLPSFSQKIKKEIK